MAHRIINYAGQIPATHNGNKVLAFSYTRHAGNLISDWSAEMEGGNYIAGDNFGISIMQNGVITSVDTDSDGRIILEGKDAGIRLMRPCPAPATLSEGGIAVVIAELCNYCDVSSSLGAIPSLGFNARSAITASTCAEAILELALLAGRIVYISNNGTLTLSVPSFIAPTLPTLISEGGTALNSDGYATQVGVLLSRRAQESTSSGGGETYFFGSTPSDESHIIDYDSGTFSATIDGNAMSGTWSTEKRRQLGVLQKAVCTITYFGVTTTFTEEHNFQIRTKLVWRDGQEYRLFAYIETGYTFTKSSTGTYQGDTGPKTFTETTTETMTRQMSPFSDPAITEEWRSELGAVISETVLRKTTRTGGPDPVERGDPPHDPEYDELVTRTYCRTNAGQTLISTEIRKVYEKQTVGRSVPVTRPDGTRYGQTVGGVERGVWVTGVAFPAWVRREITTATVENYDEKGVEKFSSTASRDDEGAKHLLEEKWYLTGDETTDALTEEYLKFTQKSEGLEVNASGGGSLSTMWQFIEFPGVQRVTSQGGINGESWYLNGGYVPSVICPHYFLPNCSINEISTVPPMTEVKCPTNGKDWRGCRRAVAALEKMRQEEDKPPLAPPVYGEAGAQGVQYLHELTIEEVKTDNEAQQIANALAANILQVKSTRGIIKTVTIPFDSTMTLTGGVVSVSHDLNAMTTNVAYLLDRPIPLFLLPGSYSTAVMANGRETGRKDRPRIGVVASISGSDVFVRIGGIVIKCVSKLKGVGVNDSVVVTMPAGSSSFGVITERL